MNESISFTVRQMSLSESGHKEFEFVRIFNAHAQWKIRTNQMGNIILSASYVNKQKGRGEGKGDVDLNY